MGKGYNINMIISPSLNPASMAGDLEGYLGWLNGLKIPDISIHVDVMREDFAGTNYMTDEEYLYVMKNCQLPMDLHLMTHDTDFFLKNASPLVQTIITLDEMINLPNYVTTKFQTINPILVMSVEAGASGKPSDIPKALRKVKKLAGKKLILDGGINVENIGTVRDAGIHTAVVGAALYNAPNREEYLKNLLAKAREL
ncbi:MAG: hypothetical protein FWE31_01455 [Firmicutes bacterium]|nr:hypothetical protein [Bacillota bacterium]